MDITPFADWMKQDAGTSGFWVDVLVTVLITALFVYVAARIVAGHGGFLASIATVLIGNFLAFLIWGAVGGTLGLVLAILAWGLVAAIFFRTRWLQGAVIGVVAALLWLLVRWLLAEYAHKAPA
ncbi:MAG: hypothetical protein V4510_11880 [bacterium]